MWCDLLIGRAVHKLDIFNLSVSTYLIEDNGVLRLQECNEDANGKLMPSSSLGSNPNIGPGD
jgi:hypothetical protein